MTQLHGARLEAVVTTDGRWFDVSPALRRLLWWPAGASPSASLYDVIHPGSVAWMRQVVSGASDSTDAFGCQLVLHDASTVWTYVRHDGAYEPPDDSGVDRVHLTFAYPVAARRLTPLGSAAEDPFRAFFENSFDAALLTAPDGRIIEANPAACAMFGYTLEELRAQGRAAVVDLSDSRLAKFLHDRETTGLARGRLSLRRKDGSRFEADLTSSAYSSRDGEPRSSIMVRDLTEQIEVEQADRRETSELARRIEALTVQTSFAASSAGIYRALLTLSLIHI